MSENNGRDFGAEDMSFLAGIAAAVVEESRVRAQEKVGEFGPNTSGYTLIRPGGRDCYPAFWIRDFAMSLESELITAEEQKHALLLTASKQQEGDMTLRSGSLVPHGAIADHISFDGLPIFFPGTLDDYEGQGGQWGKQPPYDDHYYFVHMAANYVRTTDDIGILEREVAGRRLIDRLGLAVMVPPARADSHLVYCDEGNRGVTFGFVDVIVHTGELFFCSVLKYWVCRQLSEVYQRLGDAPNAGKYDEIAVLVKKNIAITFGDAGGLFRASTGKSAQRDVWGSAFAVYVGALEEQAAKRVGEVLAEAYSKGTLAFRGNIRHVLTSDDFSEDTAWEVTVSPNGAVKNRYQNGAYWNTPTGWVVYAIAQVDEGLARQLASEYIAELGEGDFRKGPEYGSPWECMHPAGDYRQNPVYMTSVTGTLAAFRRLGW